MQNVFQIKKYIDEREKGRLKIYEDIFSKCLRRIESSVLRDESYSIFLVPDFLVGKPTYNFQNCITYNVFRLKQSGFQIKYYYPNVLYITWLKKDFNTFLQIENDKGNLSKLTNKIHNPLLDNIEKIIGSSIGSLIGLLLSLGYSPYAIKLLMIKIKYNELQSYNVKNFITNYGFDDGNKFIKLINAIFNYKNVDTI